MAQSSLRTVFQGVRLSQCQTPAAFFQHCRTATKTSSTNVNRSYRNHNAQYTSSPALAIRDQSTQKVKTRTKPNRQLRHFSTTAPSRATVIRMNPRQDDDGHEMTIEISERAAKQLRKITSTPPRPNSLTKSSSSPADSHLRITVTSGGCHGFQYLMALESAEKIDNEEDTIFEFPQEQAQGHAEVVMDLPSLELLKGSTIDYTQELIGSQFKIVGNPRAKSSCGCGTSFDID